MSIFERLIGPLIEREGGYVDHPDDRGGPTCWGITEAVARAAGYSGAMSAMPRDKAVAIYRQLYWSKPGLEGVAKHSPRVAEEMFDIAVNMGPGVAAGLLQRALNALNRGGRDYADIALDERIGPQTLGALAAYGRIRGAEGQDVLARAIDALQGERYIALAETRPANEAFAYGWLARRVG